MSKADKRERKIRENIKNVSLEEFEWLINKYGTLKFGGNHPIACIGDTRYAFKRKNPVDYHYVKDVLEFIDRLEY